VSANRQRSDVRAAPAILGAPGGTPPPDTSKPGSSVGCKLLSTRASGNSFDRSGWLDELAAIVLIVFGMVSLLSLLNTTRSAALPDMWSDRSGIFGQALRCSRS
jgi:hypothetical protein